MNTASKLIRLVSDLSAHWTDPVLDMLQAAGIEGLTVAAEIETWHTLRRVLRSELRGQAFRSSTLMSLRCLMERVLRRSAEQVAARVHGMTPSLRRELRRRAAERVATPAEQMLYARIIDEPEVRDTFKAPSRTDFLPRLSVSNVAG